MKPHKRLHFEQYSRKIILNESTVMENDVRTINLILKLIKDTNIQ